MRPPDDERFVEAMVRDLEVRHEALRERRIDSAAGAVAALREAEPVRVAVKQRARWAGYAVVAVVAGLATWGGLKVSGAMEPVDDAMAFAGETSETEPLRDSPAIESIRRDARGRLGEIERRVGEVLEGERIVFRGGAIARIERWKDGQLHGVVLDFDARGRVSRVRTFRDGVESGPWADYDERGLVRASGVRE